MIVSKEVYWLKEASQLVHLDLLNNDVVHDYCSDVLYAQYFIMLLGVGVFQAINQHILFTPQLLCGYSLGELTAFGVSTQLNLNELCSLTEKRASLMTEAMIESAGNNECGLAVLKGNINLKQTQLLTSEFNCHIAIINAEDHYIVGGVVNNINSLLTHAKNLGVIKTELLRVRVPSHTPLLNKARKEFFKNLQSVPSISMQYPILNALTNEVIYNPQDMLSILAKELSQTLHWDKVIKLAPEYGISFFLELGPRSSLKKMFTEANPKIKAYALDDFSSITGLAQFIQRTLV